MFDIPFLNKLFIFQLYRKDDAEVEICITKEGRGANICVLLTDRATPFFVFTVPLPIKYLLLSSKKLRHKH